MPASRTYMYLDLYPGTSGISELSPAWLVGSYGSTFLPSDTNMLQVLQECFPPCFPSLGRPLPRFPSVGTHPCYGCISKSFTLLIFHAQIIQEFHSRFVNWAQSFYNANGWTRFTAIHSYSQLRGSWRRFIFGQFIIIIIINLIIIIIIIIIIIKIAQEAHTQL